MTIALEVGIGVAPAEGMSNYQFGVLLGFVAIVVAAWKLGQSKSDGTVGRERGEVIFSNTPQPSQP